MSIWWISIPLYKHEGDQSNLGYFRLTKWIAIIFGALNRFKSSQWTQGAWGWINVNQVRLMFREMQPMQLINLIHLEHSNLRKIFSQCGLIENFRIKLKNWANIRKKTTSKDKWFHCHKIEHFRKNCMALEWHTFQKKESRQSSKPMSIKIKLRLYCSDNREQLF